jgi:hypothetical protein
MFACLESIWLRIYLKYIKYFWLVGLIALTFIMCVAPAIVLGLLFFNPLVSEYQLIRSLPKYPDVERVYEDRREDIGANTARRVIYYWTPDSPMDVREHYSNLQLTLLEDEYGAWYTAFISPEMQQGDSLRCNYLRHYTCVTISLLTPENPEWYRTVPTSAGTFRLLEPPDANIPPYGTLIIFNFWVHDY